MVYLKGLAQSLGELCLSFIRGSFIDSQLQKPLAILCKIVFVLICGFPGRRSFAFITPLQRVPAFRKRKPLGAQFVILASSICSNPGGCGVAVLAAALRLCQGDRL